MGASRDAVLLLGVLLVCSVAMVLPVCGVRGESGEPPRFLWPLEPRHGLSSTFGEFRAAHIHAGIDIRSGGRNGLPVLAAADGVIYRVNVTRRGYGNAVYIRHDGGLISVYGHLERFEEASLGLESYLWEMRAVSGGHFPGNLYPSVAVRAGQIIAYSGESGAGLPHLHFEIRQGEDMPVNPLHGFLSLRDNNPPIITAIVLRPVSAGSTVDGRPNHRRIPLSKSANRDSAERTPVVRGQIEIFVECHDRINAPNVVGVDGIELFLDEVPVSRSLASKVTYSQNHRVGLLYDLFLSGLSPSRYRYRTGHGAARLLPFFDAGIQGVIGPLNTADLADGSHRLSVIVSDASGNRTRAEFLFIVQAPPMQAESTATKNGGDAVFSPGTFTVTNQGQYLSVEGTLDPNGRMLPLITATTPTGRQFPFEVRRIDAANYCGWLELNEAHDGRLLIALHDPRDHSRVLASESIDIYYVSFRHGRRIVFEEFILDVPAGALYRDTHFAFRREKPGWKGFPRALTTCVHIEPAGLPLEKAIRIITTQGPEWKNGLETVSFASPVLGSRRVSFMTTEKSGGKPASIETRLVHTRPFVVVVDDSPPRVHKPPSKLLNSIAHGGILTIMCDENGRGIDPLSLIARIDEQACFTDYDPDHSWIRLFLPVGLDGAPHFVEVNVADLAGNHAAPLTFTIKLTGPLLISEEEKEVRPEPGQ